MRTGAKRQAQYSPKVFFLKKITPYPIFYDKKDFFIYFMNITPRKGFIPNTFSFSAGLTPLANEFIPPSSITILSRNPLQRKKGYITCLEQRRTLTQKMKLSPKWK